MYKRQSWKKILLIIFQIFALPVAFNVSSSHIKKKRLFLRGLLCTKIYMVILSNKTDVYNCQEDKKTIEILSFLTKIVFFLYIIFLIYKKN